MFNKYVFSDNGSLSDKTPLLEDYHSGTAALTIVATEDKLYLGSKLPFTRKYIKVSSVNVSASIVSARYWDGSAWRSTSSFTDETSLSGVTLAQSGYVSWEADKRWAWKSDDTTANGAARIAELAGVTLYDMYWLELSFSANVAATFAWIGEVFASELELGGEYPDLVRSNIKSAFETGKTSWEDQRVIASKLVSQDLKRIQATASAGLVLARDQLALAAVAKTAEVIFRGLGSGYSESMELARKEYETRMDRKYFALDDNLNGRADGAEVQSVKTTRLYR